MLRPWGNPFVIGATATAQPSSPGTATTTYPPGLIRCRIRPRWIRQPNREIGVDGFDDFWVSPEEVPIAEYVPQQRVTALRAALVERARSREGRTPELEMEAAPDCELALDALRVDAVDTPPIDREQPGAGIASL